MNGIPFIQRLNSWILMPIKGRVVSFVFLSIFLFLPELFMVVGHDRWTLLTTHFLNNYLLVLFVSYCLCILIKGSDAIGKIIGIIASIIVHFLVILFSFSNLFLIRLYHTQFNAFIIQLINETNFEESSDFLSNYLMSSEALKIILLYVALLSVEYTCYYCGKKKKSIVNFIKCNLPVLLLSLFLVNLWNHRAFFQLDYFQNEIVGRDKPIHDNIIWNFYQGYLQFADNQSVFETCANINQNIAIDSCLFRSSNIVVIIGESFNRHHSSLYDYYLDTNPRLNKEENLFVFSDVITSVNLTSEAFKNFLSCSNLLDSISWEQAPLFPAVFKKAGYNVVFYSNQFVPDHNMSVWNAAAGFFNHPSVAPLLFDYRNTQKFEYDEALLDLYKDNRSEIEKDSNNLIIFHLKGQHLDPINTFPPDRAYIKAEDILRQDLEVGARQQIANYDNSTIYNDSIVFEIINLFRDEEAIILYFSDHGDEANDFRLHVGRAFDFVSAGEPCIHNQFDIPFLIYLTDSYRASHPDVEESIKISLDRPYMTDRLPHLLFEIAGIYGSFYVPQSSIINPIFKPIVRSTENFVYDK